MEMSAPDPKMLQQLVVMKMPFAESIKMWCFSDLPVSYLEGFSGRELPER